MSAKAKGDFDQLRMEDPFAERGPEVALAGENHASNEMKRSVFRLEADRSVAVGNGAVEVFRLAKCERSKDVTFRRLRIEADHFIAVGQCATMILLVSPERATGHICLA
jgi:hypothetical protein